MSPTSPVADGSSVTINCNSDSQASMTGDFTVTLTVTSGGVATVVNTVTVSAPAPYTATVSGADAGDYSCKMAYRGVDSLDSSAVTLSGVLVMLKVVQDGLQRSGLP